jgi:hypothetical protein
VSTPPAESDATEEVVVRRSATSFAALHSGGVLTLQPSLD